MEDNRGQVKSKIPARGRYMKYTLLLSMAALHLFFSSRSYSQAANERSTGSAVTWYEGKKAWRLSIVPDEIAEIVTDIATGGSAFVMDGNAVLVSTKNRIRIWKITDQWQKSNSQSGNTQKTDGSYLPVFIDSSGRKRVLTGNIVVFMRKDLAEKDVYAWAERKNMKIIKQLSRYSNSYLIKTPPGMESLTISNDLNRDDMVHVSTPNWWTDVSPK